MPATLSSQPQTPHQVNHRSAGDQLAAPETDILEDLKAGAKAPEELISRLAERSGIDELRLKNAIMRLLEDRYIRFDLNWDLRLARTTQKP